MKKNIAIILLLSLSFAAFARLIECRPDIKEAERKRNRTYEFVDVEFGCECGNTPAAEMPVGGVDIWPVAITCGICRTKYVITKIPMEKLTLVEAVE